MKVGSLFSGIGGIELALESLGMTTVWQCEMDRHASTVLARHWPGVPNLGDITQIDWADVEQVDLICGGFPCQDISFAGKGAGIAEGTRSGLWSYFADAIGVLRPRYVLIENVRALAVRGLDRVLCDLAEIGFDAEWTCLRASDVGAPHRRERLFVLASNSDYKRGDGTFSQGSGWAEPPNRDQSASDTNDSTSNGQRSCTESLKRGSATTDAIGGGVQRRGVGGELAGTEGAEQGEGLQRQWPGDTTGDRCENVSDTNCQRQPRWPQSDRQAEEQEADHERGYDADGLGVSQVDWGDYEVAIRRWAALTRHAPPPLDERGRLAVPFVEWLMGFPAGWVDGISRSQQLKCLGNSVVAQQAIAALAELGLARQNHLQLVG